MVRVERLVDHVLGAILPNTPDGVGENCGVSALQLFVAGWFVIDPLAVSQRDAVLLALFGLSFAVALILWTEGTRRIPAAESGLLGTAETPFAIVFAWLILAELPPVASFIGGAIVLTAVLAYAIRDFIEAGATP